MLKAIKVIIIIALLSIAGNFLPFESVNAQSDLNWGGLDSEIQTRTGLGDSDPRIMAANIINIALGFLGILAVLLIIYAGWLWMSANGDSQQIEKAKKVLIGAIIGLLLIMASFGIASFVLNRLYGATGAGGGIGGGGGGGGGIPGGGGGGGGGGGPVFCSSVAGTCVPDPDLCALNQYCSASCYCRNLGAYGDPCDADTSTPSCDPDPAMCEPDLRCDDTCTCIGAPLITGISPQGGFCDDDPNQYCRATADCASGTCNNSDPNGRSGNIITISGRNFGTDPGTVHFWNGSDYTVLAPFPGAQNPNCVNSWTNTQIIVLVPVGAVTGPIRVERPDTDNDNTANERGLVVDFLVNSIARPGVCLANPDSGFYEENFNLQGLAFNGTSRLVNFGNLSTFVTAPSLGWTNTSVNASVPNLAQGTKSVYVETDGVNSNFVNFEVFLDTANLPFIEYIDPPQGPPGQYATIYGRNFRTYSASESTVQFTSRSTGVSFMASGNDFPPECRSRWWHDTYITVKVPSGINIGSYDVTVTRRGGDVSNEEEFNVTVGQPGPGICLLDPGNGNIGLEVDIYGDNMGSSQGSGFARFYNNTDVTSYLSWANQSISVNVPTGAETGPVTVSNGSSLSNRLPFMVGPCAGDFQCDITQECCGHGTFWEGICRSSGTCSEGPLAESGFGWSFTTGSGAMPGDPCSSSNETCVVDPDRCGRNMICADDCTCQLPCDDDNLTSNGCGNTLACAVLGPEWQCNLHNCLCFNINDDPGTGVGDPCDSEPSVPGCSPDPEMCRSDLVCADDCICRRPAGPLLGDPCSSVVGICDPNQDLCGPDMECNLLSCVCEHPNVPGFGAGLSCALRMSDACNTDICPFPFLCINEDGSDPDFPDDCGRCCCDPANDNCNTLNPSFPNLVCQPNVGECRSATNSRGLCCGCTQDSDCGSPGLGCGDDTCCHSRPAVLPATVTPADESTVVCRNALIRAEFDQGMQASSFTDNILLLGYYGSSPCPAGTTFIAMDIGKKDKPLISIIKKAVKMILPDFLESKIVNAYWPVQSDNYCAVSGSGSGFNNADGRGVIMFRSNNALDANRRYYVLIKGDSELGSRRGVLSARMIGMNGPHNESFNNLPYNRSFIWSFETGNEICSLDTVTLNPASHLFDGLDQTQAFTAEPRSRDGYLITNSADYDWEWSWWSDKDNIVAITNTNNPIQTATPRNHKDARTLINASARITADNILQPSTVGNIVAGKAPVYVFMCENPWPPRNPDGSWQPWMDATGNCSVNPASCGDFNYELYYCRDSGQPGTFDDLPAILRDTVIRGGTGDVLKESWFFREVIPGGEANLLVTSGTDGNTINMTWSAIADAAGYKVYWGTASNNYRDYRDVGNTTTYTITGLNLNQRYYVNLTSYSSEMAESDLYGEIEVTVRDTELPNPPVLSGTPGNRQVTLRWDEVEEGASYEVLYGVNDGGPYGYSENVGGEKAVIISGLTNGQTYYFVVRTIDRAGNISIYSNRVALTPGG